MLVMVYILPGGMIGAEGYRSLKVAEALICKDVVNRTPVDAGTSFAAHWASCTVLRELRAPRTYHDYTCLVFWRHGAGVGGPCRRFSSKRIQLDETGSWHVDVLGPQGELLETVGFDIMP